VMSLAQTEGIRQLLSIGSTLSNSVKKQCFFAFFFVI